MQVKNSPYRVRHPRFSERCVVQRGPELEDQLKLGTESVAFIEHCAAEAGKFTASATFSTTTSGKPFLDASVLCLIIDAYRNRLAEAKCSSSLGIGRIKWKGRNLLISKDGKVRVRLALSEEDVIRTLKSTSRLVWASIICGECGEPAIQCASGSCSGCLQPTLSIAHQPITPSLGGNVATETPPTPFEIEKLFNGPLLIKGYESIENAATKMSGQWNALVNSFTKSQLSLSKRFEATEIERILNRAMLSALIYIIETHNKQDCIPGLLLLGLVHSLRSMYKLVENISRTLLKNSILWTPTGAGIISKIQEIMTYAWDIHLNALAAFMHADADLALKAKKNYTQFCDKLIHLRAVCKKEGIDDKTILELLQDIEKVAVKSSCILRLT